jgi:predicted  nucleic acid-binding Zn-ribbon protein
MPAHKPKYIEERLSQIEAKQEESVEKMDDVVDDVEHMSSQVLLKLEEIHDDMSDLRDKVEEVKGQVDILDFRL